MDLENLPVGRQARVYCGLGCLAFRPFIPLVVGRLRVALVDLYSHSAVTPMTMGDDLLFCLLDAACKAPFIPAVVNQGSVGEDFNKNQGSVCCGANSFGMFSVWGTGLQAVLSIFLRSFGHAG